MGNDNSTSVYEKVPPPVITKEEKPVSHTDMINRILLTEDGKLTPAEAKALFVRQYRLRALKNKLEEDEPFKVHKCTYHIKKSDPTSQLRIAGTYYDHYGKERKVTLVQFVDSECIFLQFEDIRYAGYRESEANLRRWLLEPGWREIHQLVLTVLKEEGERKDNIHFVTNVNLKLRDITPEKKINT